MISLYIRKQKSSARERRGNDENELNFHRINLITEKVFGVTYLLQKSVFSVQYHQSFVTNENVRCGRHRRRRPRGPRVPIRFFRCIHRSMHWLLLLSLGQNFRIGYARRSLLMSLFFVQPVYSFFGTTSCEPTKWQGLLMFIHKSCQSNVKNELGAS